VGAAILEGAGRRRAIKSIRSFQRQHPGRRQASSLGGSGGELGGSSVGAHVVTPVAVLLLVEIADLALQA
jgi:hypothetical protein